MSKVITIPTNRNPFEIMVNNRSYSYQAGASIEVPDEVANAIENALALEPKQGRYLNKFAQLAEGSIAEISAEDFEGITSIESYAFYNNKSLTSVIISNSIFSMESFAFYGCSFLESIRFEDDSKLESLGSNVFDWCAKLAEVYLPETPPTLESVNAFANIKADCVFYCKTQESLDAYKSAENWSALTTPYTFIVKA